MTSSRKWQLIGLNTMYMNLQRLYVFDQSTAMIEQTAVDEARRARLREGMEVVGAPVRTMLDGGDLDEPTRESLLPLATWLAAEVEAYFGAHDSSAPLRAQAAFGAAHVYAADNQTTGERRIAEVLGDADEADRMLQYAPRMMTLVQQANAAVRACAQGEPGDEEKAFIADHVRVATGDEARMLLQIRAVPTMLEGRDPRG